MSEQSREQEQGSPRLDLDAVTPLHDAQEGTRQSEGTASAVPNVGRRQSGVVREEPTPGVPTTPGAPGAGYGYGAGYAQQVSGDSVHLMDYVRVLHKRRSIAATAFVTLFLAVTVYTFTVTPVYEATTKLLIESDNPNVVTFTQVIDEQAAKADYYQTQFNILQSRTLAKKTITELNLSHREEFGAETATPGPASLGMQYLVAMVRGVFGSSAESAGDDIGAGETIAESKVIDAFRRRVTVAPVRNSRIVDVSFRSKDPKLAADVVNALARNCIQQNLEYKLMSSKEATDWLSEQLAQQRAQVEQAEEALQQYKEENDAISLEDRENIYVQKLADLNAAVTRAKTERFEKEALYNQLRSIENNRAALDTFPAILSNVFIQQQKAQTADLQRQIAALSERLGDRHPELIKVRTALQTAEAKLQGEIGKVVQSIRNEYLAAQAQEGSLVAALEAQKREALAMNQKGIGYGVLQREVESSRQIYDALMQRAKETGVSAELKTSNIRVVDPAETPASPASPRRALNLLIALLGGGLLGVGLAFGFEYLDSRIKSPEEIKQHLGLPALGMLPAITSKESKSVYPLVCSTTPPMFSEAFRAVRTNVIFSFADDGPKTLLVTSTAPGEGKTMCAANLAVSLAQSGERVLLIDGDMRKPKVHSVFATSQEPGLSNLLVGAAKANDCVRKSTIAGLWLLPAGKTPPNPAELLGSRRFGELTQSLRGHFEWIVIDSPPVMAVIDAAVIAHLASGVVFVVGAEMTGRHSAKVALDQLENARAKFVGVILNRVELQKNGFYYSQYYKKEYASYYERTGTHA